MEHERELQCLFERKLRSSRNRCRSIVNIEKNEIVPSCIFYQQPRLKLKQIYYQDECFKSDFSRDVNIDKRMIQIHNAETQKYHKQASDSNNNLALIDLPTTKENAYPETNIGNADKMAKAQSILVYQPKKQFSYKQNSIAYYCCPARENQCTKKKNSPSIESLIYRSQHPSTGSCCCECNSDAMLETMKNLYYCYKNETCGCNSSTMFEVMENLYQCYKKKDCSDCSCKLCGIKSNQLVNTAVGEGFVKERKDKEVELLPKADKTKKEKKKVSRGVAKLNMPVQKDKTTSSEHKLILKDTGITPKRKTSYEENIYAKGHKIEKITIPEEKSKPDKERALKQEKELKGIAKAGKPLPQRRTSSAAQLIVKDRKAMELPEKSSTASGRDRLAKAYAAGKVSPLEEKSKLEKKKHIRQKSAAGVPLPVGRSASERSFIKTLHRPPKAKKVEHPKPLEGKTKGEKEKISKPLQVRTDSERSLVKKEIAATHQAPQSPPREKRQTKEAGLVYPLQGKTKQEKEKFLRCLAKAGLPLPKGKTSSEVILVQTVQKEIGLPTETQTVSEKEKVARPYTAEIPPLTQDTPLEGKTSSQIERRLRESVAASKPLSEADLETVADTAEKAPRVYTPLKGKTQSEKEKNLRRLAKTGKPLPKGKTVSEVKLIQKVQKELGLPTEPQTPSEKYRLAKAHVAGIVTPLDGKSKAEKEKALRRMAAARIPLPEGRTDSEKALINKVKETTVRTPPVPYDKLRRAKEAGLLTPLDGKTDVEKEKILRGLAKIGIPLSGKTSSEKKIIKKIQIELGLPTEPQSTIRKDRLAKGYAAGIVTPLEGKTTVEKERGLRRMADAGVPLPEGRTTSEKSLIRTVEHTTERSPQIPLGTLRKAMEAGILTPLEGKTTREKEKILRCLAKAGIPLPKGKTLSEAKLIKRIRKEMGLPSKPQTPSEKVRLAKAYSAGIVTPLEGKSPAEKEKVLRRMAAAGVPLPEGRTASERSLIKRIKTTIQQAPQIQPEKPYTPKEAGLLTSLEGKTNEEKEKILRCLAKAGIPLPEGKSPSEEKIVMKIQNEMEKAKLSQKDRLTKPYAKRMEPLKGTIANEEKALQRMPSANAGMPITQRASDTVLVKKVKATSETVPKVPPKRLRKAKEAGPRSPSERKPKEEEEKLLNEKLKKPYAREMVKPTKEKTMAKKEHTRKAATDMPLPKTQTPSDKSFDTDESSCRCFNYLQSLQKKISREKLRNAEETGLLTPLKGKTNEEKEKFLRCLAKAGIPLPHGKTSSEVKIIRKVQKEMGLPTEPSTASGKYRLAKAYETGIITSLEGKSPSEKEKVLRRMAAAGVPLPEGRTASERSLIKRIQQSPEMKQERIYTPKQAGRLTPLEGKTNKEKEKKLRDLVKAGIPLPEGKTSSEMKLIQKIQKEMGLPTEPSTESGKYRLAKAYETGIITPLEGKSPAEKEKVLRQMAAAGVPLPEGRTASERSLIKRIQQSPEMKQERIYTPKEAERLTPLQGKTNKEKEKNLRGLVKAGMPLPEGKTSSEVKLIQKIQKEMGLPTEPSTASGKYKLAKAYETGIITPLEGKSPAEKEKVLRRMAAAGVPLPEGRTASERSLIKRIQQSPEMKQERIYTPKQAGRLTQLEGKTTKEKEKKLRDLVKAGIPLPEGKTSSEEKLIQKVQKDMGLPTKPSTASGKYKLAKAHETGIITPLEGKSPAEKEKVLRRMAAAGIPLPEGRTASERSLIKRIQQSPEMKQERIYTPKEAGRLTPLEGKTTKEKEKILRGLVKAGIPLPEGKTSSEMKLIRKVQKEMGLPTEPSTASGKYRLAKAYETGIITPLEGKSPSEKEKVLRRMAAAGVPLPEGRTASERSLIKRIQQSPEMKQDRIYTPKEAGRLTPLEGKTTKEKEKILRGLVKAGIPLPEGKTSSEVKLIQKIQKEMGLPTEPSTASGKYKLAKAYETGIITPLEGKSPAEKEKVLRRMAAAGVPLPEGRTASERSLIKRIQQSSEMKQEKIYKPKEAGRLTPLEGKTNKEKEKILRGFVKAGIPLPEGKTSSEVKLIRKVQKEMGLPTEPSRASGKFRLAKAYETGIITPLEGKSQSEKEKILRRMAAAGVALPEGRTASERSLIKRIQQSPEIKQEKIYTPKEAGGLTSLEGKTNEEKEEFLRGLVKAGTQLPEGKTDSERKIIQKIRKDLELRPEKERIKKGGIEEEVIEIVKTTKCNRACGCDRKKIKFKNSYIKIHVASPDISSLCPCPNECLPVPKEHSHTFVDNEGINVIIANVAVDASSISSSLSPKTHNSIDTLLKPLSSTHYSPSKNSEIKSVKSRTTSENALVKNARPSVIKMKQKPSEAKDGIEEKNMGNINTTKFERACGCNRKKIKFKNSYIKIQVQSSDITSLSSCPYESLPETTECPHAFVDNEASTLIVENVAVYASYSPLSCSSKMKYDSLKGHLTPFSSIQYLPSENSGIENISDSRFRPPPPSYIVTPLTSKEIVKERCNENFAIGEYKKSLSLTFFSATSMNNRSIKSTVATHESSNSIAIVQSWLSVSLRQKINKSNVISFDSFDKTNNIITEAGANSANMSSTCLDEHNEYINVSTYNMNSDFESVTDTCSNTGHLPANSCKITENLVVASLKTKTGKNDSNNILSENNDECVAADSVQLSVTPSFSSISTIFLSSSTVSPNGPKRYSSAEVISNRPSVESVIKMENSKGKSKHINVDHKVLSNNTKHEPTEEEAILEIDEFDVKRNTERLKQLIFDDIRQSVQKRLQKNSKHHDSKAEAQELNATNKKSEDIEKIEINNQKQGTKSDINRQSIESGIILKNSNGKCQLNDVEYNVLPYNIENESTEEKDATFETNDFALNDLSNKLKQLIFNDVLQSAPKRLQKENSAFGKSNAKTEEMNTTDKIIEVGQQSGELQPFRRPNQTPRDHTCYKDENLSIQFHVIKGPRGLNLAVFPTTAIHQKNQDCDSDTSSKANCDCCTTTIPIMKCDDFLQLKKCESRIKFADGCTSIQSILKPGSPRPLGCTSSQPRVEIRESCGHIDCCTKSQTKVKEVSPGRPDCTSCGNQTCFENAGSSSCHDCTSSQPKGILEGLKLKICGKGDLTNLPPIKSSKGCQNSSTHLQPQLNIDPGSKLYSCPRSKTKLTCDAAQSKPLHSCCKSLPTQPQTNNCRTQPQSLCGGPRSKPPDPSCNSQSTQPPNCGLQSKPQDPCFNSSSTQPQTSSCGTQSKPPDPCLNSTKTQPQAWSYGSESTQPHTSCCGSQSEPPDSCLNSTKTQPQAWSYGPQSTQQQTSRCGPQSTQQQTSCCGPQSTQQQTSCCGPQSTQQQTSCCGPQSTQQQTSCCGPQSTQQQTSCRGPQSKPPDPCCNSLSKQPQPSSCGTQSKPPDPYFNSPPTRPEPTSYGPRTYLPYPYFDSQPTQPNLCSYSPHSNQPDPYLDLQRTQPQPWTYGPQSNQPDPYLDSQTTQPQPCSYGPQSNQPEPYFDLQQIQPQRWSYVPQSNQPNPHCDLESTQPQPWSYVPQSNQPEPYFHLLSTQPQPWSYGLQSNQPNPCSNDITSIQHNQRTNVMEETDNCTCSNRIHFELNKNKMLACKCCNPKYMLYDAFCSPDDDGLNRIEY